MSLHFAICITKLFTNTSKNVPCTVHFSMLKSFTRLRLPYPCFLAKEVACEFTLDYNWRCINREYNSYAFLVSNCYLQMQILFRNFKKTTRQVEPHKDGSYTWCVYNIYLLFPSDQWRGSVILQELGKAQTIFKILQNVVLSLMLPLSINFDCFHFRQKKEFILHLEYAE